MHNNSKHRRKTWTLTRKLRKWLNFSKATSLKSYIVQLKKTMTRAYVCHGLKQVVQGPYAHRKDGSGEKKKKRR